MSIQFDSSCNEYNQETEKNFILRKKKISEGNYQIRAESRYSFGTAMSRLWSWLKGNDDYSEQAIAELVSSENALLQKNDFFQEVISVISLHLQAKENEIKKKEYQKTNEEKTS